MAERVSDPTDRRRVLVARRPNSRLDAILPAIFGPFRHDMAALMASYNQKELAVIADFLARSRAVLLKNTARVERRFLKPQSRSGS